jgi:antitoxin HicB
MQTEWIYPVTLDEEDGEFVASSVDLPEALAGGSSPEAALAEMQHALVAAVRGRIKDESDLEPPRQAEGDGYRVALPSRLAVKAFIYHAWKASGMTKAALGRAMDREDMEVRRILDPDHGTKLDQMEAAAKALGGRLAVSFVSA